MENLHGDVTSQQADIEESDGIHKNDESLVKTLQSQLAHAKATIDSIHKDSEWKLRSVREEMDSVKKAAELEIKKLREELESKEKSLRQEIENLREFYECELRQSPNETEGVGRSSVGNEMETANFKREMYERMKDQREFYEHKLTRTRREINEAKKITEDAKLEASSTIANIKSELYERLRDQRKFYERKLKRTERETQEVKKRAAEIEVQNIHAVADVKNAMHDKFKSQRDFFGRKLERTRQETHNAKKESAEIELKVINKVMNVRSEMYERMLKMEKQNTAECEKVLKNARKAQEKQYRALSETLAGGFNKLANEIGSNGITCSTVKKPVFVMIHNLSPNEDAEFVTKDRDILKAFFGTISTDIEEADAMFSVASKGFRRKDFSDNDGIIVIVFATGVNTTMRGDHRAIPIKEIWKPFINNRALKTKPKIFLVQAIRRTDDENPTNNGQVGSFDNTLICYCEMSQDDYVDSFRKGGSIFVKSFCKLMRKNPRNDIAEVLRMVKDRVMKENEEGVTFTISNGLQETVRFA